MCQFICFCFIDKFVVVFVMFIVLVVIMVSVMLVIYCVDLDYIYFSFEVDYMGGLLVWCGKFNFSCGMVIFDCVKQIGSVDVSVDMVSVDFGQDKFNVYVQGFELFDIW